MAFEVVNRFNGVGVQRDGILKIVKYSLLA